MWAEADATCGRTQDHLASCIEFLEESHTVEILRTAGDAGMHVRDIARTIDELRHADEPLEPAKLSASSMPMPLLCACASGLVLSGKGRLTSAAAVGLCHITRSYSAPSCDVPLAPGGQAGRVCE